MLRASNIQKLAKRDLQAFQVRTRPHTHLIFDWTGEWNSFEFGTKATIFCERQTYLRLCESVCFHGQISVDEIHAKIVAESYHIPARKTSHAWRCIRPSAFGGSRTRQWTPRWRRTSPASLPVRNLLFNVFTNNNCHQNVKTMIQIPSWSALTRYFSRDYLDSLPF